MRHPAPSILDAYYRCSNEDRATEVFATVLQSVPVLVDRLVGRIGLSESPAYHVTTQVTSGTATIDLEIQPEDQSWLLWSEHKVNDRLTREQLKKEGLELRKQAARKRSRLMAITLYPPGPETKRFATDADVPLLRWHEVATMALQAELELGSTTSERGELSADLQRQFLRDWQAFSQHELEAPLDALTTEQVDQLPRAMRTIETLDRLLETAFEAALSAVGAGKTKEWGNEWHAGPPAASWLEARAARLYAKFEADDPLLATGQPVIVVGGWVEGETAVAERREQSIRDALAPAGFVFGDYDDKRGGWFEFGRTLPLQSVASVGDLDGQQAVIEKFCVETIVALCDARPIVVSA